MTRQDKRAFRRGDVWVVDLEPVRGSEEGKVRPALVIQNDVGNEYSPVIIVAAITSGEKAIYDTEVEIKAPDGGLRNDSLILLNQIRTVDKSRAVRKWGQASAEVMEKVNEAIKISLGLVPLKLPS